MAQPNTSYGVRKGEAVGGNLEFYTIKTIASVQADGSLPGSGAATAVSNLEVIKNIIQTRGQLVMVNVTSSSVAAADLGALGFGTSVDANPTTVYEISFALANAGVWDVTTGSVNSLFDSLHGVPMPFTTTYTGTSGNVTSLNLSSATLKNTVLSKRDFI